MSIHLLSTPTELRKHLTRLINAAERIDLYVTSFSDPQLTKLLVAAAKRGADVTLTTNLDESTSPRAIERLSSAGVSVGAFSPATHRKRKVLQFKPGVFLFDNESDWWMAAIVGGLTATEESLSKNLEATTLVESSDFRGSDDAGNFLRQLLNWGNSINHTPIDARRLTKHREICEAAPALARKTKATAAPDRIIEPKTPAAAFLSPLSWQELRRCDWGTYWNALLEADRRRTEPPRYKLGGAKGSLVDLDTAHAAYRAGPEGWAEPDTRSDLLGLSSSKSVLGRISGKRFQQLMSDDADFRQFLHGSIERVITAASVDSMLDALSPVIELRGVTVPQLSRILAAAAPDRFFSILGEATQLRMSNIVGFDLAPQETPMQDHLRRYVDATELTRQFPWVAEQSAERTSDHPREPDAWSKRVALLACLVG